MRKTALTTFGLAGVLVSTHAVGATLSVGTGMTYATPSAAAAVAADGDIIEIAAGTYQDVATWHANNLTIRGVGATRAHLDAAGLTISNGKAIWVIQGTNTTVENIEFSGASVPDANGAGIRQEGPTLTVRNCFFHDNQDGILAGDNATSDILIETSEFNHNGAGDGYSHNMYINHVRSFTLRYSFTHNASVGHLVKSRALSTFILYNRITDEGGTASYEVDLPNGGLAVVIGNLIQQGPNTMNSTIVEFAAEGATNPTQEFYLVNNTIVNDRSAGTFVNIAGTPTARVINNIFAGPGTAITGTAMMATNLASSTPGLVNSAGFDYHLAAGSMAIDMGSDPGSAGTQALTPMFQYVHPASSESRATVGSAIDIGAYEFGNTGAGDAGVMDASSGDSGATDASANTDVASTDAAGSDARSNSDAHAAGDAGGDAGTGAMHSGCGCRVPVGGAGGRGMLAVAAIAAAAMRRRRSRISAA